MSFLAFHLKLIFLKMLIDDLAFLILTVRLSLSFIQYGKSDVLNDFVLEKKGLIAEAEADLK